MIVVLKHGVAPDKQEQLMRLLPSSGRRKSNLAAARMAFWLSCRCHAPWLGAHLKPSLLSACRV